MNALDKITQDLKLWEQEYTTAKHEYIQFVMEYQKSHPNFAKRLERAWKETNEHFWGIEVNFRKAFKKASQQKEPQKTLDRYQAKLIKRHACIRAIKRFETIREQMLKEALRNNDMTTEIPERFKELKKRYKRAKIQRRNLQKTMKKFLNSNIFKEKYSTGSSDFELSF